MSTKLEALVWPLQIPMAPKMVLLVLADQSSDTGLCVPAAHSLTQRTCLDSKTVLGWVTWLAERDFIRPSGAMVLEGGMPCYQIVVERLDPTATLPIRQAGQPAGAVLMPIVGAGEGPAEIPVPDDVLAEIRQAFPDLNVAAELVKMRAYFVANPAKRKTKRGLGRAAMFWMERAQNSGRAGQPAARGTASVADANARALAEARQLREGAT